MCEYHVTLNIHSFVNSIYTTHKPVHKHSPQSIPKMNNHITTTNNNTSPCPSTNEKKYTGVRKRKWGKYVCEIRLPNSRERIWLGSYDTAEKAARAFDAAMFCLRGKNAKFNFPDDPPDIPGGQSLSTAEIQAVAQQYAVQFTGRVVELEDTSPPSTEPGPSESIDWSFLDKLDNNGAEGSGVVDSDMDFGQFFPEPGELDMHSHFTRDENDNDNDYDNCTSGSGAGNVSFLWNF